MNSSIQPGASLSQFHRDRYSELTTHYNEKLQLMRCYMHMGIRPCFSRQLLHDILLFQGDINRMFDNPDGPRIRYLVGASDTPGVFNLGGDLDVFRIAVLNQDHGALLLYAKSCIDVLYQNMNLDRDLTTISLVQGDALGGGFEGAMSSNVLIAERGTKLGLPEVLFNLFPGMGAYSMLSRKVGGSQAELMILSGKLYTSEELYEMGVVNVLAEEGQGETAVYNYIRQHNRYRNSFHALREAKQLVNPITYDELFGIAQVWVDAALRLTPRDLRMMERLVSRQSGKARNVA